MSVAHEQIRAFVERIERLEEERVSIARDIAEVYAEAKGNGFDRKALKIVVTRRRQDHNERMELEALVELYEAALIGFSPDDYEEVGTVVATRAPAHATRQIETPMSNASGQPGGVDPERKDDAASAGETANPRASRNGADGTSEGQGATGAGTEGATPSTGSKIDEPDAAMRPQTAGSETAVANSTPGSGAGTVDAGGANWPSEMTTASPANEPETIPPVADPATVVSEAGDDRSAGTASATVVAFRINTKTHFANSKGLPRLHGCLKPEACGGSHRSLCFGCSVQHDGPAHHEGAA